MTTAQGDGHPVEIVLDGLAHGGAAVGRLPDGRACFVDHGIPGERVRVTITDDRPRWARAELVEVVEPSPDRVSPPCRYAGPGRCGGCRLQHIATDRQAALLGDVIRDQLQRIGKLDPPDDRVEVRTPHGDGFGYRSRARFAISPSGRLAYRRSGSHELIEVDDCPLLTPAARAAADRLAHGWRDVSEVRLQVGTDGLPVLDVTASGPAPVVPSDAPAHVRRRGRRRTRGPAPRTTYEVAGHRLTASATSFFQASVAAAEVLAQLVVEMTPAGPGAHIVDCYAGVGLFSVILAARGATVTAIETNAGACADARRNARGLDVQVVRGDVASAPPVDRPVTAIVLDPPRTGAGPTAIDWIAGRAPERVTYVSCDPATFARDARRLVDHGYRLARLVGIDQFTHTGHVELVGGFARAS